MSNQACDERGVTGFIEDSVSMQMFSMEQSLIDEVEYNRILDRIEEIYTPIFEEKGGVMKVMRLWDSNQVNAFASRTGDNWFLKMHGGLARHKLFSSDGYALVACHEVGHHIGGAPKKYSFNESKSWVSNEAQSDYWANAKCFRRYALMDDNAKILANMKVDEFAKTQCEEAFKGFDQNEIDICVRGAMAGKNLGDFFASFSSEKLSFETPDEEIVEKTNNGYPAAQCRMDTYFHGALCNVSYDLEVSDKDEQVGVCNRKDDYILGARPLCWYAPKEAEETTPEPTPAPLI